MSGHLIATERQEYMAQHIPLLGRRLCLDFTNTMEYRGTEREIEVLGNFRALILWLEHAGVISEDERSGLERLTTSAKSETTFAQAHDLRDVIYQIFAARAHDQAIPARALQALNTALEIALAHRQVALTTNGPAWTWRKSNDLEHLLWPIVYSAAELLTAPELARVRQCPGCGWLFVDESRNRNRTWCDMRICGNRAKAQRHYLRQKSSDNIVDS